MAKNNVEKVANALVVLGALEVGLVGAFYWSLFGNVLGGMPQLLRAVQILVGLSALYVGYNKYVK